MGSMARGLLWVAHAIGGRESQVAPGRRPYLLLALVLLGCSSTTEQRVSALEQGGAFGDECSESDGGPAELACPALAAELADRYPYASERPGMACAKGRCIFACYSEPPGHSIALLCEELGGVCTPGECQAPNR